MRNYRWCSLQTKTLIASSPSYKKEGVLSIPHLKEWAFRTAFLYAVEENACDKPLTAERIPRIGVKCSKIAP